MKVNRRSGSLFRRIQGFTMIEFLVASSLAIIVIMAAGGTYFMTRKLNNSAQQRLNIQQNLRNTALQITRDARLAGHFGCYSTGNDKTVVSDINPPDFTAAAATAFALDTTRADGFGVYTGTYNSLPALFFVYGQGETGITQVSGLTAAETNTITGITLAKGSTGSEQNKNLDPLRQTLANGGYAVLSSCRNALAFKTNKQNGDSLSVSLPNAKFSIQDKGTVSISKLHATAYLLDQPNKKLLRMELDNEGNWQEPQPVAEGINSMDVGFGYTKDCPTSFSEASGAAAETFTFSKTVTETKMPSLVQIRFNYDLDIPPKNTASAPAPTTADYFVNATVRGGNICGNRMPFK